MAIKLELLTKFTGRSVNKIFGFVAMVEFDLDDVSLTLSIGIEVFSTRSDISIVVNGSAKLGLGSMLLGFPLNKSTVLDRCGYKTPSGNGGYHMEGAIIGGGMCSKPKLRNPDPCR